MNCHVKLLQNPLFNHQIKFKGLVFLSDTVCPMSPHVGVKWDNGWGEMGQK